MCVSNIYVYIDIFQQRTISSRSTMLQPKYVYFFMVTQYLIGHFELKK